MEFNERLKPWGYSKGLIPMATTKRTKQQIERKKKWEGEAIQWMWEKCNCVAYKQWSDWIDINYQLKY